MKRLYTAMTALAALTIAAPSQAATTIINFTGNSTPRTSQFADNRVYSGYQLTNIATGSPNIPGYTISVGDTVMGSINFDGLVNVAASAPDLNLSLAIGAVQKLTYFTQNLSFFKGSTNVTPGYFLKNSESSGELSLSAFTFNRGSDQFSFDRVEYNAVITKFEDGSQSTTTTPYLARFGITSVPIAAAVPEPATWAMMIVGFGMAGAAMRRRQRTAVAFA